jgi:hypothetical protein
MSEQFAVPKKKSTKQAPKNNQKKRKRNDASNQPSKKKKLNNKNDGSDQPLNKVTNESKDTNELDNLMENVDDEILLENPEETSSDTFSFEDSSQTESQISQTSTDLSSSLDEFAAQKGEIKIDKNVEDKLKERISKEKKK